MGAISGGKSPTIRGDGTTAVSDAPLVTALTDALIELKRIRYALQIQTDDQLNIRDVEE